MATKTFLETRVLVEKLLREVRAHPLFMTTWIFLRVILALATFANITWLLVRHGQRSQSALDAACKSRSEEPDGFAGDPEFYGLGIRLGVYFQWLTDLITMGYLEEERQYALMTYHIFSISITVALFVKVFTSPCTFSAEIFLVLVLFWGGYNIVQIPMMQAMSLNKIHQLRKEDPARFETPRSVRKLRWSIQLLNFIMYPITIWFWTRIAAVADGVDFGSTPGGTAFFFFGRIHGHGLKPFGIFMVTSSALSFIGAICGLIPMPSWTLDKRNGNKLSSLLITIAWFPLNAIVFFPSITLTLLTAFLMAAFSRPAKLLTRYLRMHRSQVDVEHGTGRLRVSRLESGKAEGSDLGTKEGVSSALIKQVLLHNYQNRSKFILIDQSPGPREDTRASSLFRSPHGASSLLN